MREILEQTRLLGEAILNSDTYRRVQEADAAMTKDPETARLVNAVAARQADVQRLISEEADPTAIYEAGRELEDAQVAMDRAPLVIEAREASKAYTEMMNQVNQLLSFILTGTSGSGCTGNCGSCGGCH